MSSSLYLMARLTFVMHAPVQLNGLLDDVPYEEEDATGRDIRFQKIIRLVGGLENNP